LASGPTSPRPEVDLETHIHDVLGVLDYEALEDAVLVGHSYAGIVVTAVADRRPERLNAVVYFDASPLPDGVSLADVQPPEMREAQRRDVEERGEGWPDRRSHTGPEAAVSRPPSWPPSCEPRPAHAIHSERPRRLRAMAGPPTSAGLYPPATICQANFKL
jgi:pimeloyl-ACP methyl ester carboxylesterase